MEFYKSTKSRLRKKKYRALIKSCNEDCEEVLELMNSHDNSNNDVTSKEDEEIIVSNELRRNEPPPDLEQSAVIVDQPVLLNNFEENKLHNSDYQNEEIEIMCRSEMNDEIEQLRSWAIEENITLKSLDKLLIILRRNLLIKLPKTAKTFLNTAEASYKIETIQDCSVLNTTGQFVYIGIEPGLRSCIGNFHEGSIELIIHVDGLPLSNSSGKTLWPILSRVFYVPDCYKPFIIAIYYGDSKPKDLLEYMKQCIEELNNFHKNGLVISGKKYNVKLKTIVADTPARSYLKCVKGHGGYHACERCTIPGKPHKREKSSQVIYPGHNFAPRTDELYRSKYDFEHHMGTSPFESLEPKVNMVTIFILDFMHLACCGVMKKLIEIWMTASLQTRFSPTQKLEILRRLLALRSQLPIDFQRKTRSIFCYNKWKATELRFCLLYCGPIIFRHVISRRQFKHFLLLHFAFRILCSDRLALFYNSKAKNYSEKFVLLMPLLYGTRARVINVHNLLHVADDVVNLQCSLSRVNAFPFESKLGQIKKILRSRTRPLAQICRREYEQNVLMKSKIDDLCKFKIHNFKMENKTFIITKLTINYSTVLTNSSPDNMVLLEDRYVVSINCIHGILPTLSEISITGKVWKNKKRLYSFPKSSNFIQEWQIDKEDFEIDTFPITDVKQKLIMMELAMKPRGKKIYNVSALLHT